MTSMRLILFVNGDQMTTYTSPSNNDVLRGCILNRRDLLSPDWSLCQLSLKHALDLLHHDKAVFPVFPFDHAQLGSDDQAQHAFKHSTEPGLTLVLVA